MPKLWLPPFTLPPTRSSFIETLAPRAGSSQKGRGTSGKAACPEGVGTVPL